MTLEDVAVPASPEDRARGIEPEVRALVARSGIGAGAWLIARACARLAARSSGGDVPLRPGAVMDAAARIFRVVIDLEFRGSRSVPVRPRAARPGS